MNKLTIEFCNKIAKEMGYESYFDALWNCSPEELKNVNGTIRTCLHYENSIGLAVGLESVCGTFALPNYSKGSLRDRVEKTDELDKRLSQSVRPFTPEMVIADELDKYFTPIAAAKRLSPVKNFCPANWPEGAPGYFTSEGWEHEKHLKEARLKCVAVTIPFLEKMATPKHQLIANRLKEILAD